MQFFLGAELPREAIIQRYLSFSFSLSDPKSDRGRTLSSPSSSSSLPAGTSPRRDLVGPALNLKFLRRRSFNDMVFEVDSEILGSMIRCGGVSSPTTFVSVLSMPEPDETPVPSLSFSASAWRIIEVRRNSVSDIFQMKGMSLEVKDMSERIVCGLIILVCECRSDEVNGVSEMRVSGFLSENLNDTSKRSRRTEPQACESEVVGEIAIMGRITHNEWLIYSILSTDSPLFVGASPFASFLSGITEDVPNFHNSKMVQESSSYVPQFLEVLLSEKFFHACVLHVDAKKNEKKMAAAESILSMYHLVH